MNIAITGANGYIGRNLIKHLEANGINVIKVPRNLLYSEPQELSGLLTQSDAIINLTGAAILRRWTKKNRHIIYSSRVITTSHLVNAINLIPDQQKPSVFITASAVGIYANGKTHTEESHEFSPSFISQVVQNWEESSGNLSPMVRKVIFRLGVVLGKDSQTILKMRPTFKWGIGGMIGNGQQAFPFIHIEDVISLIVQAVYTPSFRGIFNAVAPERINNQLFTKALAHQLNRVAFMRIPGFVLKLIYGRSSELLLQSPDVIPQRLIDLRYTYKRPTIMEALSDIN